jgi:hypothetical protein
MIKLVLVIVFLAIAHCSLIEQDPNIPDLFDTDFVNYGTNYTEDFIQKMSSETGPSQPPILDSFNDPEVRQQLRKNVLTIIDIMLSMEDPNMSGCALQRLSEAKAIRDIYMDDEIFDNRPIPRYYHSTKQKSVLPILDSMHIKYSNASSPGAWFATGFYLTFEPAQYEPVFAFGSELELPLTEVSSRSHYIYYYGPRSYYGLGRAHNVSMWKDDTDLVQWGVRHRYIENVTNYIKTQYDSEKASFLLSRMVSIDQIVLERQLLTIAHAHTNDRANAVLVGSLLVSDLLPEFNVSAANTTAVLGQLFIRTVAFDTMYYGMVVSYNQKTSKITYMTLHLATRETKLLTVQMNSNKILLNKFVPDVELQDMTVLVQLIADGNLLDQPPATTINLERGVKKIMTHVNEHIVTEDHLQNQQLNEKYHQQPESEALDM